MAIINFLLCIKTMQTPYMKSCTLWCRDERHRSQGEQANPAAGRETRPHLQTHSGCQL